MARRLHTFHSVLTGGIIRVTAVKRYDLTAYMQVTTRARTHTVRVARRRVYLE